MFKDLKAAILAVLEDATPHFSDGEYSSDMLVRKKLLQVLQAEYNIHFVEPTDKQIDLL